MGRFEMVVVSSEEIYTRKARKQTKVRLLSDRSCNFMITHIMQLISACETTLETSFPGLRADNSPSVLLDTSLSELHANLTLPDKTWVDQSTVDAIKICRIHYNQSSDSFLSSRILLLSILIYAGLLAFTINHSLLRVVL